VEEEVVLDFKLAFRHSFGTTEENRDVTEYKSTRCCRAKSAGGGFVSSGQFCIGASSL
jgi:hypothetical protein